MTYNVTTNIYAAHKLFVTTLMESFIILDTTSKKWLVNFTRYCNFANVLVSKKVKFYPF